MHHSCMSKRYNTGDQKHLVLVLMELSVWFSLIYILNTYIQNEIISLKLSKTILKEYVIKEHTLDSCRGGVWGR